MTDRADRQRLRARRVEAAVIVCAVSVAWTSFAGLACVAAGVVTGSMPLAAFGLGSLVKDAHGTVVGSSLIGQNFTIVSKDGKSQSPDPKFFQSRPSAAGALGYADRLGRHQPGHRTG